MMIHFAGAYMPIWIPFVFGLVLWAIFFAIAMHDRISGYFTMRRVNRRLSHISTEYHDAEYVEKRKLVRYDHRRRG